MKSELSDYTFDELVDKLTFTVISEVVNGRKYLRHSVAQICETAIRWKKQEQEKENKENESKKT